MIKEGHPLAAKYGRSVAEQNSFDLSWALFMDSAFDSFRDTICSTTAELSHFRCMVVNCVMATDICDKELKEQRNGKTTLSSAQGIGAQRQRTSRLTTFYFWNGTAFEHVSTKARWKKAFDQSAVEEALSDGDVLRNASNRKATIVIDRKIQQPQMNTRRLAHHRSH